MTSKISDQAKDGLVEDMVALFALGNDGKEVTFEHGGKMLLFEQSSELLLSIIESEPNVSLKHQQLRFLMESRTIGTGVQLIPLLRKMKEENRTTYADFQAEYIDMLGSVAQTTPQQKYTLIFTQHFFQKQG